MCSAPSLDHPIRLQIGVYWALKVFEGVFRGGRLIVSLVCGVVWAKS